MPRPNTLNAICYEKLLAPHPTKFDWPTFSTISLFALALCWFAALELRLRFDFALCFCLLSLCAAVVFLASWLLA